MSKTNSMPSLAQAHALLTAPGMPFEIVAVEIGGRPVPVWKHAPATASALFEAGRRHGDREFLVYRGRRITFEGFCRAALAVAAELKTRGLKKGERVGLAMRNLPEWPAVFFGTLLAGGIAVPLNAWWTGPELAFALAHSDSRFLFCDEERGRRVAPYRAQCKLLERVYGPGEAALENVLPEDWMSLPPGAMPDMAIMPEDDATLFYTSGTHAQPKGVLGSHRNLTSNILATAFSVARNALRHGGAPLPARRVTLLAVPFFHVIGTMSVLVPHLFSGGTLVLMDKFEPEIAAGLIEREKVNSTGGVPAIVMRLLEHDARHDLSSLRVLSYGGAPAPRDLAERVREKFPGAFALEGWGMTETSATCTSHFGEDYLGRPQSCGPALPIYRIKVMQGEREAAPGEVGELWAYGANIAKGYWKDEAASRETFRDGWVRSGDLAVMDEQGFCTLVGRAKDVLIRGGESISPREVEDVLFGHPAVGDAAVVGLPHPVLGEEPAALVYLKPGQSLSADALRAHLGARLAAYKLPVKILFWDDILPRNANGKIVRAELKKLFA